MKVILNLAWKSLLNRKATALLTVLTVAIAVVLLLGVERIRTQAKESFANTISGTDLIVGGRSGKLIYCSIPCFGLAMPPTILIGKVTKNLASTCGEMGNSDLFR